MATFVDNARLDDGIGRSPTVVASWNGDRRPPLFWEAIASIKGTRGFLIYDCTDLYENECENLSGYITTYDDILMNAEEY